MKKSIVLVLVILIIKCGLVVYSYGKDPLVPLKPKLNNPYHYEAEILLVNVTTPGFPAFSIELLTKIDYKVTFVNRDLDFRLEIEGLQSVSEPTSYSPKYFSTYDTMQKSRKLERFRKLFDGKSFLISAKDGVSLPDNADPELEELLEEGIIQPLVRNFKRSPSNGLEKMPLKKGSTLKTTDSVDIGGGKHIKMTNNYRLTDVTKRKIHLSSIGQSLFESRNIVLAQRLTLSKKTGMPHAVYQYLQTGQKTEMYTLVKRKEEDLPDAAFEFLLFENLKLTNMIDSQYGGREMPPLFESPLKNYTTQELSQRVDQYIDSLKLLESPFYGLSFVYPAPSSPSRQRTFPLHGAYVKPNRAKVISEEGDTLSLISFFDKYTGQYYPISHIGSFRYDIYQPQPEVETVTLELTIFVATETEEITLTSKRDRHGKFELNTSDSTVTLTYHHDGIELYEPYPMHSMKCYDKKGNVVKAQPVGIYHSSPKAEQYTALELAETYANQNLLDVTQKLSYVFEAEHVERVVLEVYTHEVPFTRTLSIP